MAVPSEAVNEDGGINWDCPCLDSMRETPCFDALRASLTCVHEYELAHPEDAMAQNWEYYAAAWTDDDDDNDDDDVIDDDDDNDDDDVIDDEGMTEDVIEDVQARLEMRMAVPDPGRRIVHGAYAA
ncbi:uncharacterized protein AMSG_00012 [Thecamonas trahens ATCC 50062]|uniref:Uncharacterized protein n=1 Tax=Thecamonas trahens ATCC 50062 TaxID=461836 RepID=A0A0L0D3M1_THETB|nr:hypothetical protein AMSG_00012 [Thecamonas trahens ATCC 50062]KNC45898.1 hypothetical protein AMSG_00012 [Thecamonas trahens ATCC 50062]|eukprot:XP_013762886.1 hypothetical protein AMSG_00012 [Thecamonas trahens ATCC 50062]